jgi:phage terminase small subunit
MKLSYEQQALADTLTDLQRLTIINMVSGMDRVSAYRKAGGTAKTSKAASNVVGRMLEDVGVRAFYDSLVAEVAREAIMTREEAMKTLSDIARTNAKDLVTFRKAQVGEDEDGNPVYQTVWEMKDGAELDDKHAAAISELSAGRDGFKFKLHSQMGAIKQLAELEGWEAPKKVHLSSGQEVMERLCRARQRMQSPEDE